jgi:hypothetical protein
MTIIKKQNLKNLIETRLSDDELFTYYFGKFKLGQCYSSPLRKDKNPSAGIYLAQNHRLRYKDLGNGDNFSIYDFVGKMYNIDYKDVLKKIVSDFNLAEINFNAEIVKSKDDSEIISIPKKIHFLPRAISDSDVAYWKAFGINPLMLNNNYYPIYSISRCWINGTSIRIPKDYLTYAIFYKKSNHSKICFTGENKRNKWKSNVNNLVDIQNHWNVDPKNSLPKLLVITKSMKECLFFMQRGIHAISNNSESAYFHPDYIRHLKKYCKTIISNYDEDEAGMKMSNYLYNQYNIQPEFIRRVFYNDKYVKDITDLYKYGYGIFAEDYVENLKLKYL